MPPPTTTGLTTLYVGPDHCAALYRNLILIIAHEDPLPDLPAHQRRWVARLQHEATGALGFVVVLRPENPPPKESARATIRAAFQQYGKVMSFGAMVVEKTGFMAAAQRSALSVIIMAARAPYPLKVFSTVNEACVWMVGKSGKPEAPPHEVVTAIEGLKAAYDAGTLRVSSSA